MTNFFGHVIKIISILFFLFSVKLHIPCGTQHTVLGMLPKIPTSAAPQAYFGYLELMTCLTAQQPTAAS